VSGVLDLAAVPAIGSTVVLAAPSNATPFVAISGFTGHLKVTEVRYEPSSQSVGVSISLEDVTVPTRADALKVMKFFSEGFGLSAEDFE
jgi:hypothetical protein